MDLILGLHNTHLGREGGGEGDECMLIIEYRDNRLPRHTDRKVQRTNFVKT